jgi:hypothetical protein
LFGAQQAVLRLNRRILSLWTAFENRQGGLI